MIHRLSMWLCCATVGVAMLPSLAGAGTFAVPACHSDGINNSWRTFRSNGYADAYIQCPGGAIINGQVNEGMVARNTGGSASAPPYSHAKVFFDAPPGARIVGLSGQILFQSTGGWDAGIHDDTGNRWLWCGSTCLSSYDLWLGFSIGGLSTNRVSALAICALGGGCNRDTRHGYAALRDVSVTVAEDTPPNVALQGGSLVAGGWRRGWQDVVVEASDGVGVRSATVLVDGQPRGNTDRICDATRAVPCPNGANSFRIPTSELSDGPHTLAAQAVDSAGNRSQVTRRIAVDNTPPNRPSALSLDGGSTWKPTNSFRLRWTNPRETAAPIVGTSIELCPIGPVAPGTRCTTLTQSGSALNAADRIRVPGPGQWRARVSLRDAAGNENTSNFAETVLRFDDQVPTLSFSTPSPDRPTVVRVKAHDVGSGLGIREVLLRRRGSSSWTSLSVVSDKNGFSATVDDEHLRDGIYELRARARDLAGNERSTDRRADGKPALLALPLRIKTSLRVGKRKRVRARGANGKRRYRIVLIEKPRTRYGRTILLRGRLTSPGGNPLVARNVDVLEQTHLSAAPWRPIATLRTSKTGRFSFRALRGPSRTLRFRFNGSDTVRGRTAIVRLGVRAASTVSVDRHRIVNGEAVTFQGRLRGRPLPPSGKLIEVQARARGRWLTFGTTRASARTRRWSLPYRFSATRGSVSYRFRVRIPKESDYPYETGTSRSVRVRVQGL